MNAYLVAATAILGLLVLAALFLWARGILKGQKSDLVASPAIVGAVCIVITVASSGSSAVFSAIGEVLLVYGIGILLLSRWAKPDCPLSKRDQRAIGAGLAIVGFCLCLVM
jgi:hypothetical protein